MTQIRQAIATSPIAVTRERIWNGRIRSGIPSLISLQRTNAVRPRVVRVERNALGCAFTRLDEQAVVICISTALDLDKISDVLSGPCEIDQLQQPSWIRVCKSRAGGASAGAWPER